MNDATEIEEQLQLLIDFVKLMQKPCSTSHGNVGDLCYAKIDMLVDHGGNFSPSVFKMVTRMMWLDDLKWKRWEEMQEVTFKFIQRSCSGMDCVAFMVQCMNVNLQKLLKAIPLEQATRLQNKTLCVLCKSTEYAVSRSKLNV